MRETDTHIFFWGDYLSNFAPCTISRKIGEIKCKFSSSEQMFMYLKARQFKDTGSQTKILSAKSPKEAKALGRKVKGFDEQVWKNYRISAMTTALEAKFIQNKSYGKSLLQTAPKILVEASPYDKIWGIGLAEDNDLVLNPKHWQGLNLLGKCLMEVRSTIKG